MQEFFQMGGYAFYVWMSYGLTFFILLINFILPLQNRKAIVQKLARKARRMENNDTEA